MASFQNTNWFKVFVRFWDIGQNIYYLLEIHNRIQKLGNNACLGIGPCWDQSGLSFLIEIAK